MMDRLMGRMRMQAKDLEEIINHYTVLAKLTGYSIVSVVYW